MSNTLELTAERFVSELDANRSDEELRKIQRYFKSGPGDYGEGDVFIGVRMGSVFELAKQFIDLPLAEIEKLLESEVHEARAGAVSIMAKQAERKKTTAERRRELYELYLRRHDRINNWDLVDLGAHKVVGSYLWDTPRDVLYELARSQNIWERRTAMFATAHFVSKGDLDDAYAIAELLLDDREDLIQKVVGGMLRAAGSHDRERHLAFLEKHAPRMPRVALRYAIEHLSGEQRGYFLGLRK